MRRLELAAPHHRQDGREEEGKGHEGDKTQGLLLKVWVHFIG